MTQDQNLVAFIQKLPYDMEREIMSFLVPDLSKAVFRENRKGNDSSYSERYSSLFINGKILVNHNNNYISRICKKNGKHRYYITREVIDIIETEYCAHPWNIYYYDYVSTYVGKNLDYAVFLLLYGSPK